MTWKELKECIDKEVHDDDEVWYINLEHPEPDDFEGRQFTCFREELGVGIG